MAYDAALDRSYGLDVQIFMDARLVEERLAKQAMGLDSHINSLLHNASYMVKEEMRARAPVGVAGTMGQGIAGNIKADVDGFTKTATIGPDLKQVPYAGYVETGTRPHMPPAGPDSALAQWAEMKGISVWAVAMSIAKKGTKPHPYVEPTYEAMKDPVAAMFRAGITEFIQETNAL
jgi:HK97 gp10 family phage protein